MEQSNDTAMTTSESTPSRMGRFAPAWRRLAFRALANHFFLRRATTPDGQFETYVSGGSQLIEGPRELAGAMKAFLTSLDYVMMDGHAETPVLIDMPVWDTVAVPAEKWRARDGGGA